MLNIPEYTQYTGELKIALMDNSSLAFMHEMMQKGYRPDKVLDIYDLILIPKWVMEEIEDSIYRAQYVEQLYTHGYPICWIDETKYSFLVDEREIDLYYIVEAAVSRISELMKYLRKNVTTKDLLELPSSEEWLEEIYRNWPIPGKVLSNGRILKKNAGEISLTILAEVFSWYHDEIDTLTIYTQDADAYEFQTNAEQKLRNNQNLTSTVDSPISVSFKSNDFILCEMYRDGELNLDDVRQFRNDNRKVIYVQQQADKSISYHKEVITTEQFIALIQDQTVQILF